MTARAARRRDGVLALIELGSNAARFVLARLEPGTAFEVLDEERVQTRLGSGLDGRLPAAAVSRTVRAVQRFLRRVREGPSARVLAVATAAVRDASNGADLLARLERREGLRVQVLSGEEEARLGVLAVRRSLALRDGIVADLGGGSLQITRLRAGRMVAARSLPLGAVRLTARHLRADPPAPEELRALRLAVRTRLAEALPVAARGEPLVALGGTVRALARIHLTARGEKRSRQGLRLDQPDVAALRARLEFLPLHRRRRVPGLKTERADIIVAGAIVIEDLLVFGGYPALTVCTHGVRDGLLVQETFGREA